MKQSYLVVVLGLALAGTSASAQMGMRGGSANGSFTQMQGGSIDRAPVSPSHGDAGQRVNIAPPGNMGGSRTPVHQGGNGDRVPGDHRVSIVRGGIGDRRGDFHGRGGDHDHDFDHHRHGHTVIVFFGGVPYYCFYPDYGYYGSAPSYGPDYAPASTAEYTTDPSTETDQYVNQGTDAYYQPGYQWGGELQQYHVTMDQFVTYLKSYILTASPVQQAAFRSGFVANFGQSGQSVYDQAVQQAIQPG